MPENEKDPETEVAPLEESETESDFPKSGTREKAKVKSRIDNLLKRDVSFLQKKLAELEIAISEVQENVQKIDVSGTEELKQRVEDIEDLSMVENAGIIELKKMLEDIQSKLTATHELEEKVGNLEQIMATPPELSEIESKIKESVKAETSELQTAKEDAQSKLDEMSTAISDLSMGLSKLSESVPNLEKKIEEIDVEKLKTDVKNSVTLLPGFPTFDVVTRELEDSITSVRQDVENYKIGLERIKRDVEEKLNDPSQIKLLKELEDIRSDSLTRASKIGNIELFIEDLSRQVNAVIKQLNEINPLVGKFNRFDAEELKEEIKDYITPLIPEAPDLNKLKRGLEDSIEQLRSDVEAYKRDSERLKQNVEEKFKVPLHTKLLKELEDVKNESLITHSKFDAIDSFTKELAKEIGELRPVINRLGSKIESFEGLEDVEKSIDEKLHEFRSVLATVETIKENNQAFKEIDHVLSRLRDVEGRLSEIRNFVDEFEKSKEDVLTLKWKTDYKKLVDDMNRKFENLKREMGSEIFGVRTKELEEKIETVARNVSSIQNLAMSLDKKSENSDKIVKYLENDLSVLQGNLMALENISSKTSMSNVGQLSERINSLESSITNMSQLPDRLNSLEIKMSESSTGIIDEIVNRLVFLESRLATLESALTTRSYPIVIE